MIALHLLKANLDKFFLRNGHYLHQDDHHPVSHEAQVGKTSSGRKKTEILFQ